MLNSGLLKQSQPINAYKLHACKKECMTGTYTAMHHVIHFAFHHMCTYVYLYIYEDVITTEVQIYIRGISFVRTSPNSSTKQLRTGLHEQLKTKSTRLAPLTSRNKLLRFNSCNFVNYKEKIKTANNLYVLVPHF